MDYVQFCSLSNGWCHLAMDYDRLKRAYWTVFSWLEITRPRIGIKVPSIWRSLIFVYYFLGIRSPCSRTKLSWLGHVRLLAVFLSLMYSLVESGSTCYPRLQCGRSRYGSGTITPSSWPQRYTIGHRALGHSGDSGKRNAQLFGFYPVQSRDKYYLAPANWISLFK